MADFQPFAGMSQEDTNQTMLYLLSAILEKLPRTDGQDRLLINGSEVAAAATNINVVSDLNRIHAFGQRAAEAVPLHLANSGALHLYDRIVVT
jgi:hypothetical protein